MEKIINRDFNDPKEVSLGDIKKDKFGKVVQVELSFKDGGIKYNLQLHHPHKPLKYNGTCSPASIEWDNLSGELGVIQITRIVVHRESNSTSISFYRLDDIQINIICKDVSGLP
jgi:hypothetical protein